MTDLERPMGLCPSCGADGVEPCTYPRRDGTRVLIDRWHVHHRRPESNDMGGEVVSEYDRYRRWFWPLRPGFWIVTKIIRPWRKR